MKKRKKLSFKKITVFLIVLIFLGMFIYSAIRIINYLGDNKENKEIKETINEYIVVDDNNDDINSKYDINFSELKKQNSDTVAYLKVDNTNIDYVVLKANDNSYYLNHNFNKNYNVSGWVFADYHNKFNGSDKNIVIFGHNTYDGSMFGSLGNVLDESWYTKDEKILLVTEKETHLYQVFSIYTVNNEEYYINTIFNSDSEYRVFLETIKARSIYNFNVYLDDTTQILTLSTCTASGTGRVVLHAKMV